MLHEAMLFSRGEDGLVHCGLCAHRCRIAPSKFGVCGVRENREGRLLTLAYGEVIAANVDPIEKKPLYHFLPGTVSFSVATAGCNFSCAFCQNWRISQVSAQETGSLGGRKLSPEEIVKAAVSYGCRSVSYTYTEPTVFFEYAYETSRLAREDGLANVFVTNGFMTPEALEVIHPCLDACNVDLKFFSDETYKRICHGRLQPVLDSIRFMKKLGIWVEVTTLVVPGLNDSREELGAVAAFLAETDPHIPWHISRFHPDYKFADAKPTPLETLRRAGEAGRKAGLKFIYIGNVWGESEDTLCPQCRKLLIRRRGFSVGEIHLRDSRCPTCGAAVAGVFEDASEETRRT